MNERRCQIDSRQWKKHNNPGEKERYQEHPDRQKKDDGYKSIGAVYDDKQRDYQDCETNRGPDSQPKFRSRGESEGCDRKGNNGCCEKPDGEYRTSQVQCQILISVFGSCSDQHGDRCSKRENDPYLAGSQHFKE